MVNFLRERALAYHKDAYQASLKEILEEFENEMKLDFWDVKRASDCEKVLASWNRTLLQCKQRFGGAEDGYMGGGADDDGVGVVVLGLGLGLGLGVVVMGLGLGVVVMGLGRGRVNNLGFYLGFYSGRE